jgi:hypothetical protein
MGRPRMGAMGFPGKRVEPIRAGIIATIFIFIFGSGLL